MANFTPPVAAFTTTATPSAFPYNPYAMFDVLGTVKPSFSAPPYPPIENFNVPLLEVTRQFTFTDAPNLKQLNNAVILKTFNLNGFSAAYQRATTGQLWPRK